MSVPALKTISRSATSAWCASTQCPSLLALGTSSHGQVLSADFSYSETKLELVQFDLSSQAQDMPIVSSIDVEGGHKFNALSWGIAEDGGWAYGLLAGAMQGGVVTVWNPHGILNNSPAPIWSSKIHEGNANWLEFHPQKSNLIATCGSDGEVNILNIDANGTPDLYKPCSTSSQAGSEILCCAWNRKFPQILCASSNKGTTVVYDLKQKKEVIAFRDPSSRQLCVSVAWNPEIATQLITAYEDASNAAIQMWDLRNPKYPFKEIAAHTKGVSCVAYNPMDHNLLVSSGKDGRTIVWCQESGTPEVFCEVPTNQYNFDVKWSPTSAALLSTSSINNAVSLYSTQQQQNPDVLYTPKWYERSCGATFGFAGKFVRFGKKGSTVEMHLVPSEPEIVPGADRFEQWVQAGNLNGYCGEKVNHFLYDTPDEQEALVWDLIGLYISSAQQNQPFAPPIIVEKLGFKTDDIMGQAEKFLGSKPGALLTDTTAASTYSVKKSTNSPCLMDASPDFFENLAAKTEAEELQKKQDEALTIQANRGNVEGLTNWNCGPEMLVKQALLIGNLPCAVEVCLKSGRFADALLLASGGGNDLWKRTRDEYMKIMSDPFLNQIGSIMTSEFDNLIMESDLASWKETLSIIATYASPDRYRDLCCLLAERLEKEKFDVRSALLCYICARNFPKTVHIWASMASGHASQKLALQDLVEKMTVWQEATQFQDMDPTFSTKLSVYANVLANSGRLVPAMRQLYRLPDVGQSNILKDRIYQSSPHIMSQSFGRPPRFPYDVVEVRPQAPPVVQPNYGQQPQYAPNMASTPAARPISYGGRPPAPQAPGAYQSVPAGQPTQSGPSNFRPPAGNVQPNYSMPPGPQEAHPGYAQPGPPASVGMPKPAPPAPRPPLPSSQPPRPNFSVSPNHAAGGYRNPAAPQPGYSQPQTAHPGHEGANASQPPVARTQSSQYVPPVHSQPPSPGYGRQPQAPQPSYSQPAQPGYCAQPVSRPPPGPPKASTAPTSTAAPVTDGLPVPWPVPTAQQNAGWVNQATLAGNQAVQAAVVQASNPWNPVDTQFVLGILNNHLAQTTANDPNRKRYDDVVKRLNELYEKINAGALNPTLSAMIMDLCRALERQDLQGALKAQVDMSSIGWDQNKNWLQGIKRILAR